MKGRITKIVSRHKPYKLLFVVVGVLFYGQAYASWTVDGLTYDYRKKITIQNANISSDLSSFPVYVSIKDDTNIGGISNADGFDHRFTSSDGSTLLEFERESFAIAAGAATGHYWVKTNVTTADPTDIYIYYRSADTADGSDAVNTWDANFIGVWHCSDNAANTTVIESTSNPTGGVLDVNSSTVTTTTAAVNRGFTFNGTSNYVFVADNTVSHQTGVVTTEGWVRLNSDYTNTQSLMSDLQSSGTAATYELEVGRTDKRLTFFQGGTEYLTSSNTDIQDNNLHHVVAVRSGSSGDWTITFYLDGSADGSVTSATNPSTTASGMTLGRAGALSLFYLKANVDEFRLSNLNRSAAWIHFEYHNIAETDNELTWGAQEPLAAVTKNRTIIVD